MIKYAALSYYAKTFGNNNRQRETEFAFIGRGALSVHHFSVSD